ncbi:MAG: hypothetical protein ACHQUA_01675 [Microgenomates group bacterium]
MDNYGKIRQHYNSLIGLISVFNDTTPKSENIALSLVREYERFMDDANKDLPDILSPFNKDDFFAWGDEGSPWFESAGIKAHMQRNLGILKTKVDDFDQTPVTEKKSFNFINESVLRKILERDYQEIQRNIIASNWKSAIILSGGAIEAILLDLLTKNSSLVKNSTKSPKENNLLKWDLDDLINVSVDTKLVGDGVADLSHSVRGYRNLVHPGVEIRSGLKVEPEEAKIAVQVLNMLIRDLS